MANNAQTALTNRQYYAAHLPLPPAAPWFKHTPIDGKPTPPDASSLTGADVDIFAAWQASRENGSQSSTAASAYSSDVLDMISDYEDYYASDEFIAWAHDDLIAREAQWRLRHADLLHATESGGVVPISADPAGKGKNALVGPVVPALELAAASASGSVGHSPTGGTTKIPAGATEGIIELWGAGEGGSRDGTTLGSDTGGGSGAYLKKTFAVVPADWGIALTWSAGSGGAGKTTVAAGGAGDDTTVDSFTVAAGTFVLSAGGGGQAARGQGGSASGGDINIDGANGAVFDGGDAPYGGLGGARTLDGNSPGGGGGGADSTATPADAHSGAGGNGRVKFTWAF